MALHWPPIPVRNPGIILDQEMSLNVHVKQTHLCRSANRRNILFLSDAEKLISNSFLSGCPKSLKSLQLIKKCHSQSADTRQHIFPISAALQGLSVKFRISSFSKPQIIWPHHTIRISYFHIISLDNSKMGGRAFRCVVEAVTSLDSDFLLKSGSSTLSKSQ